jgi:hypothetical protein
MSRKRMGAWGKHRSRQAGKYAKRSYRLAEAQARPTPAEAKAFGDASQALGEARTRNGLNKVGLGGLLRLGKNVPARPDLKK